MLASRLDLRPVEPQRPSIRFFPVLFLFFCHFANIIKAAAAVRRLDLQGNVEQSFAATQPSICDDDVTLSVLNCRSAISPLSRGDTRIATDLLGNRKFDHTRQMMLLFVCVCRICTHCFIPAIKTSEEKKTIYHTQTRCVAV